MDIPILPPSTFDPRKITRYRHVHIVEISEGDPSAPIIILGDGHSVTFDPNGHVTWSDPLYRPKPTSNMYGNCTVYAVYFPTTCGGLFKAARQIACFVNQLPADRGIVLNGHSKCGCCFITAAYYILRPCTIVSVSAPLRGTPTADLQNFPQKLSWLIRRLYLRIFSDHSVDRDIIPGSEFLRKLQALLPEVSEKHNLHLVISRCGISPNPLDWVLWILDKLMEIGGDGIVPYAAQFPEGTPVPESGKEPNEIERIRCHYVRKSHATSLNGSLKCLL